jgi:hypothetical protein
MLLWSLLSDMWIDEEAALIISGFFARAVFLGGDFEARYPCLNGSMLVPDSSIPSSFITEELALCRDIGRLIALLED